MNVELTNDERVTLVGVVHFRLRHINSLPNPELHSIKEMEELFIISKKLGVELVKDAESGEITVKLG